jgi:hypothetical protein
MASQVSPGIVLKERDLSNAIIVGASQITAAHASTFQKGPIGTVVNISSQKDLLSVYGAPTEANAEDWFVASEFLNYGGRLAVTRALTDSITSANGTAASNVLVKNDDDWNAGNGNGNYLVARTPGTWANDLLVVVVDRGPDQIVTFNQSPAGLSVGDTLTFSGTGGTGIVASIDAAGTTASIVLNDPSRRLTTSDSLDSPDTGVVSGSTAIAGGATYQNGTAVATTGGTGTGLTVNTTVNQGTILTFTAGVGGSAYVTANSQATTSNNGAGCIVNVVATAGAVTGITIVNGGNGYVVGDNVIITGGSGTASFTVDTVEGSVTGVTIAAGGSGYVAGDTITITGGTADATFNVGTVVDTAISLTAVKDWYTTTEIGTTGLNLGSIGPRPGTSQFAAGKNIKYDEVHVAVIDTTGNYSGAANTVLERVLYVSKLTDAKSTEGSANHIKDVVNAQSTFLFTGINTTGTINPSTAGAGSVWGVSSDAAAGTVAAPTLLQLSGKEETVVSGGVDDYDYSAAEIETAFELFSDTETVNIDFVLMGGSRDTIENTKAKANKIISIAAARKDCVAFISPHKSNQVGTAGTLSAQQQKEKTLDFFSGMTSSSYAVFDSGYKYYYDRFNDKYRYIPCNGDIAGLCVSTSATLEDWYSPAGVNRGSLRNAIKLAYNPSKADRDELYQSRINPIVVFPGSGVTLFGDKTALSSPSAFDRINVRRLFLNLEERVGNLAKAVLFEQNDSTTRASFSSAVNSYLSEVQARRGVTDFLVVCDDTNNTPDVIDRNEFVAELFVKPTRSINYITVTFTATKTGVSFSEVIGR